MEILPTIKSRSTRQKLPHPFVIEDKNLNIRDSGFTLLEMLVVIFIIGLTFTIATISIGQKGSQVVRDEAERLNGLMLLASEEAVMQGREMAVEFSNEAYSFYELGADNQWLPISDDKLFRERVLSPDIKIELVIEGEKASFEDKKNLPRLFVLSSGELTPFTLTLSIDEGEAYILQGAIDGKLQLSTARENELDA